MKRWYTCVLHVPFLFCKSSSSLVHYTFINAPLWLIAQRFITYSAHMCVSESMNDSSSLGATCDPVLEQSSWLSQQGLQDTVVWAAWMYIYPSCDGSQCLCYIIHSRQDSCNHATAECAYALKWTLVKWTERGGCQNDGSCSSDLSSWC